ADSVGGRQPVQIERQGPAVGVGDADAAVGADDKGAVRVLRIAAQVLLPEQPPRDRVHGNDEVSHLDEREMPQVFVDDPRRSSGGRKVEKKLLEVSNGGRVVAEKLRVGSSVDQFELWEIGSQDKPVLPEEGQVFAATLQLEAGP